MSHVSYAEPPAQGWDIHCHTVFSDGTETPRTLVEQARKLGLHGVAIADHDTTAGWDEATEASEEIGLPLLLGTEITAVDEDVSVHMLAFQYDPSNEHISSMFANTRAARLRRTRVGEHAGNMLVGRIVLEGEHVHGHIFVDGGDFRAQQ